MENQKPKIFLSYAREDIDMAKRIYQDLKRYGLDVWIDYEKILPGQHWKIITEKSIRQSKYFLLLLSSNSVTKRGFIQKEMKIAYEILEQCSEEDIYLIPVRVNDCEPSLKISDIHYINVFPETEYQNGLKKILHVVSPGTFIIRREPKKLSPADVNEMVKLHDYYDVHRNPEGKGINHQYVLKELNGEKVILDEATGLMWQKNGSDEYMDFKNAKQWIIELNRNSLAGFTDWRLPTLEEAMSLIEPEMKNEKYIDPIFDSRQNVIWTADQVIQGETQAMWIVGFDYGVCDWNDMVNVDYMRAVRSEKQFLD